MMYTTHHLSSAQDITPDIIAATKVAFKSKPITITIEEEMDTTAYLLPNPANKADLEKSMQQLRNGQVVEVRFEGL